MAISGLDCQFCRGLPVDPNLLHNHFSRQCEVSDPTVQSASLGCLYDYNTRQFINEGALRRILSSFRNMANPPSSSSDDPSSSPIASAASESVDRGRSRVRRRSNQFNEHHSTRKRYSQFAHHVSIGLIAACRRGYHTFMSSFGKIFHVEKRWKLVREMGSGAYGVVV